MSRLFEPNQSHIAQYFICPQDLFALNSLELLEHDEYIYRILRQTGYERVIFVAQEHKGHCVYAFDAFSQFSYLHQSIFDATKFSERPEKRQEDIARFISKCGEVTPGEQANPLKRLLRGKSSAAAPTVHPFGKRTITTLSGDGALADHFHKYMRPALESAKSPTAIVMPIALADRLRSRGGQSDAVNGNKNILLLTAEHLSQIPLQDQNRAVIAGQAGPDEIANLLYRHILLEHTPHLCSIPLGKVYPLAGVLWQNLSPKNLGNSHFHGINLENGHIIRHLNDTLSHPCALTDELIASLPAIEVDEIKHRPLDPFKLQRMETSCPQAAINTGIAPERTVPDVLPPQPATPLYRKLLRAPFVAISEETRMPTNRGALKKATDPSILFITSDNNCGTGFLIHPDGYALTCYHVIEGASTISARVRIDGNDTHHSCQVVNVRRDIDIALLKLEGSDFPFIPLAPVDYQTEWDDVLILSGYPFGKLTAGDLTSFKVEVASSGKQFDDGIERIFISGDAKRGNSGSPLISTQTGNVVGILTGSVKQQGEEINYYRPIHYFWKEFLK